MCHVFTKKLSANSIIDLSYIVRGLKAFNHDTRYRLHYHTLLLTYTMRFFVKNNDLKLQVFDHLTKRKRHITHE
jgi:hypothetical protein